MGFESAKELKEFMDAAKQKAEDDKEEGEKLLEAAIKEAQEEARHDILDVANAKVIKAEFLMAAKDHDIRPGAAQDAYVLAQTLENWSNVEIDDAGVVSGFDDDFFKDLKDQKSFLFETAAAGDIGAGNRSGGGDDGKEDLRSKYPALNVPWIK
jgi:hypothetical protein